MSGAATQLLCRSTQTLHLDRHTLSGVCRKFTQLTELIIPPTKDGTIIDETAGVALAYRHLAHHSWQIGQGARQRRHIDLSCTKLPLVVSTPTGNISVNANGAGMIESTSQRCDGAQGGHNGRS